MVDLRNHLFATIEALMDNDENMEVEKAKAIADLGRVLIDSARAETELVALMRKDPFALDLKTSGFLQIESAVPVNPGSTISPPKPDIQVEGQEGGEPETA